MAQNFFGTLTSPSLPLLDANFSELYAAARPGELLGVAGSTAAIRWLLGGNQEIGYRTNSTTVGGLGHHLSFQFIGGGTLYGIGLRPQSNNTNVFTFANAADTVVGSVYTTATGTLYNTSSDLRLKQDVCTAQDPGAVLDRMRVVSHRWRSDPDEKVRWGFVAQELHEVMPEAVTAGDDAPELGGQTSRVWGVDLSKLVPMLVAEVQRLRARVQALEASA